MHTIAWLLPAAPPTHYELIGEILETHLHALSKKAHVWGIAWNENLPGRTYTFNIWNAYGRLVSFWGAWGRAALTYEVERLWKMENFHPQVVITGRLSWQRRLAQRWQRRYKAFATLSLPLSSDHPIFLGGERFADSPVLQENAVCLWVQPDGAEEAAFIADLLALQKHHVYIVGTPRHITPLRSVAARFRSRIHIRTGLPYIETQLYAECAQAIVYVGKPFDESVLLQVGTPRIVPATHPLASHTEATYAQPQALPSILSGIKANTPFLSTEEAVEQLISYLGTLLS